MANPSESMPLNELNHSKLGCETPPFPLPNHHQKFEDVQNSPHKIEDLHNYRSYTEVTDSCKCKVSIGLASSPDRLKLPKPFKYPERYTSPTDNILSPISKGLLARKSRRGAALLPPSIQSKIQELRSPNVKLNQLNIE